MGLNKFGKKSINNPTSKNTESLEAFMVLSGFHLHGFGLDLAWIWPGFGLDLAWIWPGFGLDLAWM
jgi:hypothetical protein